MYRRITLFNIVTSRKPLYLFSFVLVMSVVSIVLGAEKYVWTGDGLDGLWNTASNWDKGKVPEHNCGAVSILYSEDNTDLVITIPAGYTADCTFGDEYGTIYAPAFGMHLDIYGSLTYKWYLASGQTNPAGQRSVINMYSGSSIYGGEGIAIGDNWWLPGPYVTMNMYGDASVDINWLWLGGHLNMYGGIMDISQGVNMCVNVDDSLCRLDIYAGKLILPADFSDELKGWISRGILLAYGHTPGKDGYEIVIDTTTQPGRTVVTAAAGKSNLADLYYLEKDKEAQLWSQMALAVYSIEEKKITDAQAIKNNLVSNFSSNPRLPDVLFYVADMYESYKRYGEAEAVYRQIAQQFSQSPRANDIPFALEKLNTLVLIEAGGEDGLNAVDDFAAAFRGRADLAWYLSNPIAERMYGKAFELDSAGLESRSKAYFQKVVDIWEQVSATHPKLTHTADGFSWAGHCYRRLGEYEKAISCYSNVAEKFPDYDRAWNALFLVGRCYEDMQRTGAIDDSEAKSKIRAAYQELVEKYPDCKAARIAKSWLSKNNGDRSESIYEE